MSASSTILNTIIIDAPKSDVWDALIHPAKTQIYTDWTSVIVQSLLRQIEPNTCIHRHLPLYDFSIIGPF